MKNKMFNYILYVLILIIYFAVMIWRFNLIFNVYYQLGFIVVSSIWFYSISKNMDVKKYRLISILVWFLVYLPFIFVAVMANFETSEQISFIITSLSTTSLIYIIFGIIYKFNNKIIIFLNIFDILSGLVLMMSLYSWLFCLLNGFDKYLLMIVLISSLVLLSFLVYDGISVNRYKAKKHSGAL